MSIENDNLPKADGQEENVNQNSDSLQENPAENETTGNNLVDIQTEEKDGSLANEFQSPDSDNSIEQSLTPESENNDLVEKSEGIEEKTDEIVEENKTLAENPLPESATQENLETDAAQSPESDLTETSESPTDIESTENESQKPLEKDFDESADLDQHHEDDSNSDSDEDHSQTVPIKDYDEMSLSELVKEASYLLAAFAPQTLKEAFNGLRDAFRKKSEEEEQEAKQKFLEEGGNEIDFRHDNRFSTSFYDTFTDYRAKVDAYYKEEQNKQELNLKEREAIIDELKALYTEPSMDNRDIFKKFRDLKTRWHNAGRIPKTQASNIFKTYYFHLDNFNEFLDLNQELRKMDYEHNLEVRRSIIERANKLLEEDNVQQALNELQYLHRMWKEEAVPVAEEHREPTWQEFKAVTGKIHDRKTELNEQILKRQEENLSKKQDVIKKISELIQNEIPKTHNTWQRKIKEMKSLRDEFFALGRVPKEHNQPTWDAFKEASRFFNHEKNSFYKNMKDEQMENLEKKRKLIEIALEHKNSSDWNESVAIVKRIQSDWKKIGHVPRKFSDKIWKEFSDANNEFFDRYKNRNNEKLEKQQHNLEMKEAILIEMEKAEKPKEKEKLIEWLNTYSIKWSAVGLVPSGKQDINKKFSSLTEKILLNAGLSKNAIAEAQWENEIERIKTTLDENHLRNLKYDLRKEIDEVQKEVTHLQTNLAFFSNADDTNPLFKNAIQNIENKVNELKRLESNYDDLKLINLEALAEAQKAEEEAKAAQEAEKLALDQENVEPSQDLANSTSSEELSSNDSSQSETPEDAV
ncbi:MAG: DUF349 domain-containing protein [Flavobacteriaceae bacterium]|nr:DUF349 domain-containing protein [Flavobacteriaceae bacterium]